MTISIATGVTATGAASTSGPGAVELATNTEAKAVTSQTLAVTPGNLAAVFAEPPALGSTTRAAVSATTVNVQAGSTTATAVAFEGETNTGLYKAGTGLIGFVGSGAERMRVDGSGINLGTNLLKFGSAVSTTDVSVLREAADTLAQRRTTNPQIHRIYNTFTDASNYERGVTQWASNVFQIGTEAGGTGTLRNTQLIGGQFLVPDGSASAPPISFTSATNTGITRSSLITNALELVQNGSVRVFIDSGTVTANGVPFRMNQSADGLVGLRWDVNTTLRTTLFSDAANTLGLRNSTNAQTLRIYNTFTDASNYERGVTQWASNVFQIGTEAGGTGTLRNTQLIGGQFLTPDGSASAPAIAFTNATNSGFYHAGSSGVGFVNAGAELMRLQGGSIRFLSSITLTSNLATSDLTIARDAADTLAQRRSTNAQTHRWYSSYTDASNNEGVEVVTSNSGSHTLQSFANGTGTSRALLLNVTGSTAGIVFRTGSTSRFQIGSSGSGGHFTAATDNTYDIGSSGANRPRDYYGAGKITSAGATAGVGYATGAGGTVTQATDKSTGVTLNKVTGQITLNNATLNAGDEVGFTVTNSAVAATDVPLVAIASGATANSYMVGVDAVASGSFHVVVSNVSSGNLGEAIVLNFVILKGVTS
jgi:hypothetical protein